MGQQSGAEDPQSVAARVGITLNAAIELTPRGDRLVVSVLKQPHTELDELLAGVTEDNVHGEVETGPPVGGEARVNVLLTPASGAR